MALDRFLAGIVLASVIGYLNGIAMLPWYFTVPPVVAGTWLIHRRLR